MPTQIPLSRRVALQAAAVLVPVLLAANTTATEWAQCPLCRPLGTETVLIGFLVDPDDPKEPSTILRTVKVDFNFYDVSILPEEYTLKVFKVYTDWESWESLPSCLQYPHPVAAQPMVVESELAPMESTLMVLNPPIETGSEALLFAIEMSLEQLRTAGVLPVLAPCFGCEQRTYYSLNDGLWEQLDNAKLSWLREGICPPVDGSIHIKIQVQPG